MLARCGVGTLALIDLDYVEKVNLNRLFFTMEHIGRSKVEVAKEQLSAINPDVIVEAFHTDLCAEEFEDNLNSMISPFLSYLTIKLVPLLSLKKSSTSFSIVSLSSSEKSP